MKKLFLLTLSSLLLLAGNAHASAAPDFVRTLPVQHNGRIKPFDAFARQTLKFISGRDHEGKKSAVDILFDDLNHPAGIPSAEWIRLDYFELKTQLGLPRDRKFFSLNELSPLLPKIQAFVKSSKDKRDADVRPSRLEQKAETLLGQIRAAQAIVSGESLRLLPSAGTDGVWTSPYAETAPAEGQFAFILEQCRQKSAAEAARIRPKLYLEVLYYRLKPFECAAVFYFLGFLCLTLAGANKTASRAGTGFIFTAILLHTLGIAARVYILSRPPVSNMYESMIFMNWAVMIYASVFSLIRKNTLAVTTGAALSGLVMLYANLLPIDSSLEVLVPVLRSNYWLTIHVMTIVSSYGAFGLAMALGHRHLFALSSGKMTKTSEEESASLIFRVIQLGTLLIGTGTFLGGVWANESWGRFWGWDPKETWALITFLGYLIIVHLRYFKKINNFYLALSSVLGFLLVLMTWYGVNFVLGRGLHSYGAGSGGMQWVVYYLIFEALFVGFIMYRFSGSPQKASRPASKPRK